MIDLVIFDCDGVLVDSEPLANRIFAEHLNRIGLNITVEETIRDFVGRSMSSCLHEVEKRLGHPIPKNFNSDFDRALYDLFDREITEVAGVSEMLNSLEFQSCIASSGTHEKLHKTLGITNLFKYFEGRIFSAVDVARGKPNPDLFIFAAQKMGIHPNNCVVIEDSFPGVMAARAASMKVLGYCERTSEELLSEAGAITFRNMKELPQLLLDLHRG